MSEVHVPPAVPPGIRLLEPVSRTNLSEVWKGVRAADDVPVAVKFASGPCSADMLRQEALTVQSLLAAGVPGIVPAEFAPDPVPHLLLPWKGRRTLRDAISNIRSGDDRSRATRIFLQLVEIVARVHQEGFLHGDLKPENVLLDDQNRPWLTDFGMARMIHAARLDSRIQASMSRSEEAWGGTLNYLPPEGIQGDPPTQAWDVYALGVVLHEILLGRRPDRAATPEQLRAVLPERVLEVLLGALAYSPADRFVSAPVLLQRLQEIRSELTATGPIRWFHRGKRLALAGLGAFFVALRYGMVAALALLYLAIAILAVLMAIANGPVGLAVLLFYVPFLLLHLTIRWEGPETQEEARLRQSRKLFERQERPTFPSGVPSSHA